MAKKKTKKKTKKKSSTKKRSKGSKKNTSKKKLTRKKSARKKPTTKKVAKKRVAKKKAAKRKTTRKKSAKKKAGRSVATESVDAGTGFWELWGATLRALDEARSNLRECRRAEPPPTEAELSRISIALGEIEVAWQRAYQQGLAATAQALAVPPPSPEQLQQAKAIADRLDQMAIDANSTPAVFDAVTDLMSIWGETNSTGGF